MIYIIKLIYFRGRICSTWTTLLWSPSPPAVMASNSQILHLYSKYERRDFSKRGNSLLFTEQKHRVIRHQKPTFIRQFCLLLSLIKSPNYPVERGLCPLGSRGVPRGTPSPCAAGMRHILCTNDFGLVTHPNFLMRRKRNLKHLEIKFFYSHFLLNKRVRNTE